MSRGKTFSLGMFEKREEICEAYNSVDHPHPVTDQVLRERMVTNFFDTYSYYCLCCAFRAPYHQVMHCLKRGCKCPGVEHRIYCDLYPPFQWPLLPTDTKEYITRFMDSLQIMNLSATCREMRGIIRESVHIKRKIQGEMYSFLLPR